jgi:peptidoglycan/LPS O-acetylase OafA/YrhL
VTAQSELRALTSARGVAAWMVVLYHIRPIMHGLPGFALQIFGKGYLAVDFFFLLSGFVIWLSWGERLRDDGWRAARCFLQKRVARIWPLHLVILAGASMLALVLAATGRSDPIQFPFRELPLHIFLFQNWGFTDRLSWNNPAWSISCEIVAYLAFPFFARAIDWRRFPSWLIVSTIAMLFLIIYIMIRGEAMLDASVTQYGMIRCLTEFSAGTALCALWMRWREAPALPAMCAATTCIAALVAWAAGAPETLAAPTALAALLLTLALTSGLRRNPLDASLIRYLGEISYATYLSHFILFIVFKLLFVSDELSVPLGLIALYLAMVLASSIALHHLVERPAQRWINGLRPARSPALPATPR